MPSYSGWYWARVWGRVWGWRPRRCWVWAWVVAVWQGGEEAEGVVQGVKSLPI